MDINKREEKLQERLEQIKQLEAEIKQREKALKAKEKEKKQVLLRLAPSLWEQVAVLAEENYRSINGQIEYILSEAVRKRKSSSSDE